MRLALCFPALAAGKVAGQGRTDEQFLLGA